MLNAFLSLIVCYNYKVEMKISEIFCFLMLNCHLSYSLLEKKDSKLEMHTLKNELHCQNWNATITTMGDSLKKLIQATLRPDSAYEKCFTRYFAYLRLLKPKYIECNLENGALIDHKEVDQYFQGKERSYKVNFTNFILEDRYYCILFEPCAERCYDNYLHSEVIKIEGSFVSSKQNVSNAEISSISTDIAYICVVLVLTLICSMIIYWNYKQRKKRKIPKAVIEELPFLPPKYTNASDTKVTICYFPNELTKEFVDCLANFMQEHAQFIVTVIDGREPDIHNRGISDYFEVVMQGFCSELDSKCVCNKRLIIVITDSDVAYLKSLMNNSASVKESIQDFEANWFIYALHRICVDLAKCLKDYTHFCVIYFGDIQQERDVVTIAPGVRFSIQHKYEIVKICQQLNRIYKDPSQLNNLVNSLENHPIKDVLNCH